MHRFRSAIASSTFFVAAAASLIPPATAASSAPILAAVPKTDTTLTISIPQSAYGQPVTATATVSTTSGTSEGDVVFSVDGVATKANLGYGGVASLVLPKAMVGQHAVVATFVPGPGVDQQGSASPPQTWTVAQVRTRLQVRVIGKGVRIPTSVQVKAAGEYGSRPTGRVRFVVRRTADRTRVVVAQRLSSTAVALAELGKLTRGKYRLEVTYVGDSQHLRERHVETFRVQQR